MPDSDSGDSDGSRVSRTKTPRRERGIKRKADTPTRRSLRTSGAAAALPLVTLSAGSLTPDPALSAFFGPCTAIATSTGLPADGRAPHVARTLERLIGDAPDGCTLRIFHAAVHELISGGVFIDPASIRAAIAVEEARYPRAYFGHTAETFVNLLTKETTDAARAFIARLIGALANEQFAIYALHAGARLSTKFDVAFTLVGGKLAPCAAHCDGALPVLRVTSARVAGELTERDVEFVLRSALNALKGHSGDIGSLAAILKELAKRRALITPVGRQLADALCNFAFLPDGLPGFIENVALTGLVCLKVSALARLLLAQLKSAAAHSPTMLLPASWNAADRALGGGMPRSGEGAVYLLGLRSVIFGIAGATWDRGLVTYTPGSRAYTISSAYATVALKDNPPGPLYGPFESQGKPAKTCELLSLGNVDPFAMEIRTQVAMIMSTAPDITKEELLDALVRWLMHLRDTTLTPETLAVHAEVTECAAFGILVFVLDPRAVTVNCTARPTGSNIDCVLAALLNLRCDGNTVHGARHGVLVSTAEFTVTTPEVLWHISRHAHESEQPPRLTTIALKSEGHSSVEFENFMDCLASFLGQAEKCGNPVEFFFEGIRDIGDRSDEKVEEVIREQAVRNLTANESGMPNGTPLIFDTTLVSRCGVLSALEGHLAFLTEGPLGMHGSTGNQASGDDQDKLVRAITLDGAAAIQTVKPCMIPEKCDNCTRGAGSVACANCTVQAHVRAGTIEEFWLNASTQAKQELLADSSNHARAAAIETVRSKPHDKQYGNIQRALGFVIPRAALPDDHTFAGKITLDRPEPNALREWPRLSGRLFHNDEGSDDTWSQLRPRANGQ